MTVLTREHDWQIYMTHGHLGPGSETKPRVIQYICDVCHSGFKWGLTPEWERGLSPDRAKADGLITDPNSYPFVNGECPGACEDGPPCWGCCDCHTEGEVLVEASG